MSWDTPATDETFRKVYELHGPDIRDYCRRRVGRDEAEDAVSETFAVAWRRRDQMPEGDGARLWLYGVARNVIRNSRRGANRRHRLQARLIGLGEGLRPGPTEAVELEADHAMVLEALSSLRESDQEILRLHAWEELNRSELSEVLGISPAAADMRLLRALRRMGRAMAAAGVPTNSRPRAGREERAR